ncbi:hypothetical protein M9H77_03711 [Catharanthus roseus]|uniref:Uncharacterized protein n=1 Tax=Catharanthus roseus TaxID=4058 RepID=A0ACC0CCJ7_CATRO|nr:hypothetical protein M9H77_03711 [Catharanthus roseus]
MWREQGIEGVGDSSPSSLALSETVDRARAELEAQSGEIDVLVGTLYGSFMIMNTRSMGFRIDGLELPKLVHFRTNHGLGTIFKKSSKWSTYPVRSRATRGRVSITKARLIDTDENKTRQFVKGLKVELQQALAPLPPMRFAAAVEAVTRMGMADQTVIQRKVATGPVARPYKRPGQGP